MRFPPSTSALLLWSAFAFAINSASADTASHLYEQGKYQESYERFKKAAEHQKNNWPLFYDLGAAAYKAGQLGDAAEAFEKAMASPDPLLQAKSLYNLGNTYYRIGEAAEKEAPQKAMPVYEQALKTFENAIAADPKDEDAKFNRDAVKKKLEELKKKQQQQQQKQDQQKDPQKKDQDEDKEKQDQNQQQQNQQQQSQKNDQKQDQQQQNQQKKDQQQGQQGKDQKPQEQPSSAGQTNNLEKMQAQILLDNLREEERNWNFFPELQVKDLKDAGAPAKDW
jgi:Ca-activated chloride channel family protein